MSDVNMHICASPSLCGVTCPLLAT